MRSRLPFGSTVTYCGREYQVRGYCYLGLDLYDLAPTDKPAGKDSRMQFGVPGKRLELVERAPAKPDRVSEAGASAV